MHNKGYKFLLKRVCIHEFTYLCNNLLLQDRPERKLRLSGYGVELQMKSTEYKATDDSDIKENQEKTDDGEDEDNNEVEGINFATLK